MGIVSDTLSWNTVSESSTVTPKSKRKRRGYSCLLTRGKAFLQGFGKSLGRGLLWCWCNKQTATTGEYKVLYWTHTAKKGNWFLSKDCLKYFEAMKRKSFVDNSSSGLLSLYMGCNQQNRIIQNKHGWFFLLLFLSHPSFFSPFPPVLLFFSLLGVSLPCGTIAGRAFLARVYLIIPHSTLMCHIS